MNINKFKGKLVWIVKTRQSTEPRWMPKHKASALRTSIPIWPQIEKKKKEREIEEGEMEHYLSMGSHHTVRGRRLRVRRALGTRRTLWHRTKEMEQKRSAEEKQRKKRGYCRAGDSLSARNKVWRTCKNKMLICKCCIPHRRDSREEQANDLAL